jgi:hypothetical protein
VRMTPVKKANFDETPVTRKREHGLFYAPYLRKYVCAWDAGVAVVVFGVVWATAWHDTKLRPAHVLDLTALLGGGILAVVIAAIAILTALFTEDYGFVLRAYYKDDLGEAFYPYRLIALTSCLTVAVSVAGTFAWDASPGWAKGLELAIALAFASWSIFGTLDLVGITAGHGRLKLRMPEIAAAYRDARAQRKAS